MKEIAKQLDYAPAHYPSFLAKIMQKVLSPCLGWATTYWMKQHSMIF